MSDVWMPPPRPTNIPSTYLASIAPPGWTPDPNSPFMQRAVNQLLSSSGPSIVPRLPTTAGPTTPNFMPQSLSNILGMPSRATPGNLASAFKPAAAGSLRGWAGRGLGAAGIYGGLNTLGNMIGTDNATGYGVSSAALPAAGAFMATGAAAPTAVAGLGVGLGTAGARLIPGNEDNSWGNVFENVQRRTGTYAPDAALPATMPPSVFTQAFVDGKLDENRLATILANSDIEGADRDDDGNVILKGDALKMLETIRENPEQMAALASFGADLTPEDMQTVDEAYTTALLLSEDPDTPEARQQALDIARMAVTDVQAAREQEEQFTQQAIAFQAEAQRILAPVTASMDAQAQMSYDRMMQASSMLPPDMQGIARLQAEQNLASSQTISNAYRGQAAMMLPAMWMGQQQDQINQIAAQLQPQAMSLGIEQLLAGAGAGGMGAGGGGGMTLADLQ